MLSDLPRRAVEDRLREEMLAAQQRYFTADREYARLRELSIESDADSHHAREQAARARKAAFEDYARTLHRYSDMVVHSRLPEDLRQAG